MTTTTDGHDGAAATKPALADTTTSSGNAYISRCGCSTRCWSLSVTAGINGSSQPEHRSSHHADAAIGLGA
jgi:hypothetical protein